MMSTWAASDHKDSLWVENLVYLDVILDLLADWLAHILLM